MLAVVVLGSLTLGGCAEPKVDATASPALAQTPGFATFGAIADAYVQGTSPTRNFGGAAYLGADSTPVRRSYLRFTVSGLSAPATKAVLRLHSVGDDGGSPGGGRVAQVSATDWSESGLNWRNQPLIDGPTVGTIGEVTAGSWYEVDVTKALSGDGTYTFAITSDVGDGAYYDSREAGANGPRLVLTVDQPKPEVLVGAGHIGT